MADLEPQLDRYRITSRRIHSGSAEVTLRLRSLLTLMGFLSLGVEVPAEHIERDLAEAPVELPGGRHEATPLRILSSSVVPPNAWVMVEYRGQWFYIDATDHQSRGAGGRGVDRVMLIAPRAGKFGPHRTLPTG